MHKQTSSEVKREFTTTRWSIVIDASDVKSPKNLNALETLCETYWYPLYFYVRRLGVNADDAKDLIQGFFETFFEKNYLQSVERDKGRFRAFLKTAVKRYVINEWRRGKAQKRGGSSIHVPLDFEVADNLFSHSNSHEQTAESTFDREWAISTINTVFSKLETSYNMRGQKDLFQFLKSTLPGQDQMLSYQEAGVALNCTENTIKSHVMRFRKRFKECLREVVAETVQCEQEIDEEIKYLIRTLKS